MPDAGKSRFQILHWNEALLRYGAAWADIVTEQKLNPSMLPDWQAILVSSHSSPEEVRVLLQFDCDKLTGVLPYRLRKDWINAFPVTLVEPITSILAYHAELVTQAEPEQLLLAFLNAIEAEPWHILRFSGVLNGTPTADAIIRVASKTGHRIISYDGEQSPYLTIDKNWDEMVAARSKRKRYQMRQRDQAFYKLPQAHCEWYDEPSRIKDLLEAMSTIERSSWKAGAGIAIYSDPREYKYLEKLLSWLATQRALVAHVNWSGEIPIAYDLVCFWNGWAGYLKGSYHQDYAAISVGNQGLDEVMKSVVETGAKEIDFLGNAEPYKLSWTSTTRPHTDFFLYRRRSRAQILAFAQTLRDKLARTA